MPATLPLFADHSRAWQSNRYVYPVISRRSKGLSIGVNLNPDKACNYDCIYCCVDRSERSTVREVLRQRARRPSRRGRGPIPPRASCRAGRTLRRVVSAAPVIAAVIGVASGGARIRGAARPADARGTRRRFTRMSRAPDPRDVRIVLGAGHLQCFIKASLTQDVSFRMNNTNHLGVGQRSISVTM